MSDVAQDFEILQGATLSLPFYWYDGDPVIKPITAVAAGYPPTITAVAHGLPTGKIPVQIASILGPTDLNTADGDSVYALKTGADTFVLPDVNSSGLPAYVSGGYLIYQAPKDLTTYNARMQIRQTIGSPTVLLELTDINGDIVLGGTEGSVTLVLTAIQTAALAFNTAVYQIELVAASGVVTRLAGGTITLNKEVTR